MDNQKRQAAASPGKSAAETAGKKKTGKRTRVSPAKKKLALQVIERLKQWNGVIPPAVCMSLRYPVGPCECNAQWVIGDAFDVIFIDAVTGEISNWNPAFNPNNKAKGGDFGKPLGEWP